MKLLPALLLASTALHVYAADYYVVVPFIKKAAAPAVSMTLSRVELPTGVAGAQYAGQGLGNLLTVLGDTAFNGSGVAWQVASGALPTGLQLDPATGMLSGTPATAGIYSFSVRATYKKVPAEQSYQLSVGYGVALASATLPAATEGQSYTFDFGNLLSVTGDPDYQLANATFGLGSGALPAGLALSARGVLSGTPTAPSGPVAINLAVDYKGGSASKSYTLPAVTAVTRGVNFASHLNGATIANFDNPQYYGPNPYWPYAQHTIYPACTIDWVINSMLCLGNTVIAGDYKPGNARVSTWAQLSGKVQYAVIDLGQPRKFNTAYFYQADQDGRTTSVSLATADALVPHSDLSWTTIGSRSMATTDFKAQKLSFTPVTARYVRIGVAAPASGWIELRGLQLFYE